MLHSKCQIVIPLPRDMALEDAWGVLKDKEYTGGQKSFIDRATKNLDEEKLGIGSYFHQAFYKMKADAQKKVGDMLSKDFGAVDWKHNALSGNHMDVQEHMEHAMMRAQMRMHAINANNLDHPCLHSDKWFYQPKHFNSPRTHGFESPTGGLFDRGEPLHDIFGNMDHGEMEQSFNPGGVHHQENMPEGLGAARPSAVGPRENYPDHAAPGFGVRDQ